MLWYIHDTPLRFAHASQQARLYAHLQFHTTHGHTTGNPGQHLRSATCSAAAAETVTPNAVPNISARSYP